MEVVVAVKQDALEFHAPGCNHLSRKAVFEASQRDIPIHVLRSYEAEAQELNQPNPIKPCLKEAIS